MNLVATFYDFKFIMIDWCKVTIIHHLNQGLGVRQTPPNTATYRHVKKGVRHYLILTLWK